MILNIGNSDKILKSPILDDNYPKNETVSVHNSITSEVVISTEGYPASYTYQWYKDGNAVSGATSSSYTFTPTTVGTITLYCEVTNKAGTVISRTATITATPLYIFKSGVGATSGFVVNSYNLYESSISTSDIWCHAPGLQESNGASGFSGAYDFTNYTRLVFDVYKEKGYFECGYLNSVLSSYNPSFVGKVSPSSGTRKTYSIDISGVKGYKYVAMKMGDGSSGSAYVYNIYLE